MKGILWEDECPKTGQNMKMQTLMHDGVTMTKSMKYLDCEVESVD